jgi:DNA-binding response OmpR family regulator
VTRAARILVAIEDETTSGALGAALHAANYQVRRCGGAAEAPQQVVAFRPDLVIMDLPAGDGRLMASVVRQVHAAYRPMLLGILDGPALQVSALEAGADACVDRPCTIAELEAHIRALLRRATWLTHTIHQLGGLVVDEAAHVALYDDDQLALCAKEFALLSLLVENSGTVLSKRALLDRIWGFQAYDENLVEVHISSLRRRLPDGAKRLIHTVRGVGYVLRDDQPQGRPA